MAMMDDKSDIQRLAEACQHNDSEPAHLPRKSTVQAARASRVWVLTAVRFAELCNRQAALALAVTLALGSLLASRLADRRKRIAVT